MLTGSVSRTPCHGCCRGLVIDKDSDHAASQLVNDPLAEPQVEITAQIGGTSGAGEIRTVESAQLGRKQEAVARNKKRPEIMMRKTKTVTRRIKSERKSKRKTN
jgi:hypothetical protein